jgi:Zn-dependent alcohol dehydrogenase
VKGAVCREFGAPLVIEELELDPPERGEARVRVVACAICSSDVAFAAGAWGGSLPAVYGHEAAGIVEEVGSEVTGIRPGDRVVVSLIRSCGRCFFCERGEPYLCEGQFPGDREGRLRTRGGEPVHQAMHTAAFAEEVVVDQSQLAVVPDSIPLDLASLLGCGVLTGFGAVAERAAIPAGASVLVIGTGGVGLSSVQAAAIRSAAPIIAVDVSPAKREIALRLGATHFVDAARLDATDEIRRLTDGRGADYVLVTVGRAEAVERGLVCVRRGGTVVVVGMPPSGETFSVEAVTLANDDVRVLGSKMGSARLSSAVPQLVEHYEQGRLELAALVSARYPLDEINEALEASRRGDTLRNVIVFE